MRRLLFALLALALLCTLCAPFFTDVVDHDAPRARGGVVDYSHYGPLNAPAGPTALMLVRTRTLKAVPPAAGWDGVWDDI